MIYEQADPHYDAITFFLGLALADGAFLGIASAEALLKLQVPADRKAWQLQWKDEVLELPVVRVANAGGVTEEPFKCQQLFYHLRKLSERSGYPKGITIHAVRRGVGNEVNRKPFSRLLLQS